MLFSMLTSLPNLITLELLSQQSLTLLPTSLLNNLEHLYYRDCFSDVIFKQFLLLSSNSLKSLKVNLRFCLFIEQVQQQCPLNLTHFHLVIKHDNSINNFDHSFNVLIILLRNLPQLVHLKLSSTTFHDYLSNRGPIFFKAFSQALAYSLKIFEVNLNIPDEYLKILFDEPELNIQYFSFYCRIYGKILLNV